MTPLALIAICWLAFLLGFIACWCIAANLSHRNSRNLHTHTWRAAR